MKIAITLFCLFYASLAHAQINFDELDLRMAKEKRYIVVYVHSRYCAPCLMQEAQINKDSLLLDRLKNDFYYVSMEAESSDSIIFNHQRFVNLQPKEKYGVNKFVRVYGENRKGDLAYPLWLYFDKDYRLILRFYGLMPPKDIRKVLDKIEEASVEK